MPIMFDDVSETLLHLIFQGDKVCTAEGKCVCKEKIICSLITSEGWPMHKEEIICGLTITTELYICCHETLYKYVDVAQYRISSASKKPCRPCVGVALYRKSALLKCHADFSLVAKSARSYSTFVAAANELVEIVKGNWASARYTKRVEMLWIITGRRSCDLAETSRPT